MNREMNAVVTISESPLAPAEAASAGRPAEAAKPPRIWKFWATLAWSLLLYGVMTVSAMIALTALLWWSAIDPAAALADGKSFLNDGVVVAATSMSATVPVLLAVAFAVRLARQDFRDYLALHWPTRRHLQVGVGAIVLLMVATDTITALAGRPIVPDVLLDGIRSARQHNALGFYALALVVTAPITEEAVFRGFIYRGFAASRLGRFGAVILSSLIFTAVHIQYDLITLCGVLATALLLGTMRCISGSTLLTIAMHALNNSVVLLEMLWFAGLIPHA
jgi:membrane protease YdiL (CAAX protease family)